MQDLPPVPGLGAPIPPTDVNRAAGYQYPRPGMQVSGHPGVPPGYRLVPETPQAALQMQQQAAQEAIRRRSIPLIEGPPTQGLDVFTVMTPTFKGRGDKVFGFRELSVLEIGKLWVLLEGCVTWGIRNGVTKLGPFIKLLRETRDLDATALIKGTVKGSEAWLLTVLSPFLGVQMILDDVYALLEGILVDGQGVSVAPGTLTNPKMVPPSALPHALVALSAHPDIASFFGSCQEVAGQQAIQQMLAFLTVQASKLIEEEKKPAAPTEEAEEPQDSEAGTA